MQKIKTVLLVDDDKINNFLNERIIRKLDIAGDIKVLYNGMEGFKYLTEIAEFEPDKYPPLVLLDINMPVMDGFEFIDSIKSLPGFKTFKIIILTTSRNLKDLERIRALGDFAYLNKPLTKEKLLNCLEEETAEENY